MSRPRKPRHLILASVQIERVLASLTRTADRRPAWCDAHLFLKWRTPAYRMFQFAGNLVLRNCLVSEGAAYSFAYPHNVPGAKGRREATITAVKL